MQTQPQQTPAPEQEMPQAWSKPHIWKISEASPATDGKSTVPSEDFGDFDMGVSS
jgi:hypothetical protein